MSRSTQETASAIGDSLSYNEFAFRELDDIKDLVRDISKRLYPEDDTWEDKFYNMVMERIV